MAYTLTMSRDYGGPKEPDATFETLDRLSEAFLRRRHRFAPMTLGLVWGDGLRTHVVSHDGRVWDVAKWRGQPDRVALMRAQNARACVYALDPHARTCPVNEVRAA